MLHDGLHAAGKVIPVQITVQHIAVAGIHVRHGDRRHVVIGVTGTHAAVIVIIGAFQIGSDRIAGVVMSV